MREIRTYGSEGGEAPQGAFPTLIQSKLNSGEGVLLLNEF